MQTYKKTPEALAKLTPEQFYVTQESGTERPGTGALLHNKEPGIYVDIVSGEPLFASTDKFDSGSGWPSFTKPIEPANVSELRDLAGTLRHGLVLFPQTRRLVLVAGVERTQTTLPAQLTQVLSTQQRQLDIEDTSALSYEAMLRRIASLPPDTLVLLSTYFQDSTGRNFIPAEEAAAVAKWADARAKSASFIGPPLVCAQSSRITASSVLWPSARSVRSKHIATSAPLV